MTSEIRERAVLAVNGGIPRATVATAFGVDRVTLYRWLRKYETNGGIALERKAGSGRPRKLEELDEGTVDGEMSKANARAVLSVAASLNCSTSHFAFFSERAIHVLEVLSQSSTSTSTVSLITSTILKFSMVAINENCLFFCLSI